MTFFSCSSDSIKQEPIPIYNNSFILSYEGEKTTIGHLDEGQVFTPNVYESLNKNTISFSGYENKLFAISQTGPDFVTKFDLQSLVVEKTVATSQVADPSYLTMYSETEGLMVSTDGRGRDKRYNLSLFNINEGIKDKMEGISDKVLFSKSGLLVEGESVLIADGKELKVLNIKDKSLKTVVTFEDVISGILKDKNNKIWVGTEKRVGEAAFVSLGRNYSVNETITLEGMNLYKTSMLTMSLSSNYIYWLEVATGAVHRFNTVSKEAEEFVNPMTEGVMLTTVIKEHPTTGQVYVLGAEDFFDTDKSVLVIYNEDKTVFKTVKGIGSSPIDIFFSKENFSIN
ncbi:hypothetical protein [Tenacibaculum sp. SDUM215027]|uniref:hypothetical protein n=1 Tax=Tenacibaculum sp. SDUM215027 TaxID=3422596 RepID=UPI003D30FF23